MSRWSTVRRKLEAAALALLARSPSNETRRRLLGAAIVLFVATILVALPRVRPIDFAWPWLVGTAILSLGTTALNSAELWLAGRWLRQDIRPFEALEVSVFASAANLAPVPGALLVRGRELYSRGGGTRDSTLALATIGLGWLVASLFAAGLSLLFFGRELLATAALFGCITGIVAIPLLAPTERKWKAFRSCLVVECLMVGVQALRFFTVFQALGVEVNVYQVLTLPLSGAVANAAGLFPGGLGLREILAGGIAELVSLKAAAGVVGSGVDRIVGLLMLAVLATILHFYLNRNHSNGGASTA